MNSIIFKLSLLKVISLHFIYAKTSVTSHYIPHYEKGSELKSNPSLSSSTSTSTSTSLSSSLAAQRCLDTYLRTGYCVSLNACPQLIEEFYSKTSGIDFQTYVSDLFCDFDGQNFLICCTARSASLNPTVNILSTQRPIRFLNSKLTKQPSYDLSLGSLFQFAPLTALNGVSPVILTPSTPSQLPLAYTTISPTSATPPMVFQPSTSVNQPNMFLTIPGMQLSTSPAFNPTSNSFIINPTSISTVLNPVPSTPISVSTETSNNNCGISSGTTNRVVGGVEARRGSYPWLTALGYYDEKDGNSLKFLCAGSLISQNYVLTSAHCVTSTLVVARLGAHDLSRSLEPNSVDLHIKRTIVHESFDIKSIANDIALLELSAYAPITDFIRPICLPEGNSFLNQDFVGMHPFVAGWGANKHQGSTSNVLRDAQVPIVNRQICEQNYKTVFRFIEFSDRLICAGNSNVDACQGDSGGPLMLPIQGNGNIYRYFLIGIVSYGYECARNGFPGVYTRVASYIPWIRAHQT